MKKILYILAATTLLASCAGELDYEDKKNPVSGQGELTLALNSSGEFITKAGGDVDVNTFKVMIKNATGQVVQSWAHFSEMPEAVKLNEGDYEIEVHCMNAGRAVGFDNPIYRGNLQFTMEPSIRKNLNVDCKLSNMKVSVNFVPELLAKIKDNYKLTISSPDGALIYDKQESRAGYFLPATLTLNFEGYRLSNNAKIIETITIPAGAAQDHHVITVSLEGIDQGTGQFGISIDYTTNDKPSTIVIPDEDEDEEEPGDPAAPTVTGPGISSPLVLTDAETEGVTVDINIATNTSGIAELWVRIQSDVLTADLLQAVGLDTEFDLANLTPEREEILKELGLIGSDPVAGAQNFTVSIGMFMQLIFSDPGGAPQNHLFHVTVKDNDGHTTAKTLTITRIKE